VHQNWTLSTVPLSVGASSREKPIANLTSPETSRVPPWQTFLSLAVWEYLYSFSHSDCLQWEMIF